jgi:glycosyltransferase involved in cell wall biosynthesis
LQHKSRVTTGLRVKNSEATIEEAMDSILYQDFPHELIELIVVDGYSTDKILLIIKEAVLNNDIKARIFRRSSVASK